MLIPATSINYFRRGQNNELTYLPFAEKRPYRVDNGNIADPWIYLFPEKVQGRHGIC